MARCCGGTSGAIVACHSDGARPQRRRAAGGISTPQYSSGPALYSSGPALYNSAGIRQNPALAGSVSVGRFPPIPPPTLALAAHVVAPALPAMPVLKVYSQTRQTDIITTTLTGDYEELPANHGRKAYKKIQKIVGYEEVSVYLYYWDGRDGEFYSGWWFGDQVGGSLVWAKAPVHTPAPPTAGWRIPWDSDVSQPGALVVEPAAGPVVPAAVAASPKQLEQFCKIRVTQTTQMLDDLERAVIAAVEISSKVAEKPNPQGAELRAQLEALTVQQTRVAEAQRKIAGDIAEIRKHGEGGAGAIKELAKLSPNLRTMTTVLSTALAQFRSLHTKAEMERTKIENQAKMKEQEGTDMAEFKSVLPKVRVAATAVELMASKVESSASRLLASPPLAGEALNRMLAGIVSSAEETKKRCAETRDDVNAKLALARRYAPECRQEAVQEYSKLQQQLTDAQKRILPLCRFAEDFPARVEARSGLSEANAKFAEAESEIDKASKMVPGIDVVQLTEEEMKIADSVTKAGLAALNAAQQLILRKLKGATAAMQAEIAMLRARVEDLKNKLEGAKKNLKAQRDATTIKASIGQAQEKIQKAETCAKACEEAEIPFIRGIENLSKGELDEAISQSEKATQDATVVVMAAKTFVKAKLALTSQTNLNKGLAAELSGEMAPMLAHLEAMEEKVKRLKKETRERRQWTLLGGVEEATAEAEHQVSALEIFAVPLTAETLEDTSVADLKAAVEKCQQQERLATPAWQKAKQALTSKLVEAKKCGAGADIDKCTARLKAEAEKLSKTKLAISAAAKFVKVKEVLQTEGEKLRSAQHELEVAESATMTGIALNEASVKEMDEAVANAENVLKTISPNLQELLKGVAAKSKEKVEKLLKESKAVQEKLNALKADAKTEREEVLAGTFKKEAEELVDRADTAIERCDEVELPFLKGLEEIPLEEAKDAIEEAEEAANDTQEAIDAAKAYMKSKTSEAKGFVTAAAVRAKFSELTNRLNALQQKLAGHKKDTAVRKKTTLVQEAGVMVAEAEEFVEQAVEAASPFTATGGDQLSEKDAESPLERFLDLEKEAKEKLESVTKAVVERTASCRENTHQSEAMKKLVQRLHKTKTKLQTARKALTTYEHQFMAKRILKEVEEKISTLDGEVEKAAKVAAPLVDQGADEYLVRSLLKALATGLTKYAQEKSLDVDALFKAANVKKTMRILEPDFLKYLAGLAELTGQEMLGFTEQRRKDIFKLMSKDKGVSLTEFSALFNVKCTCTTEISFTDGFALESSKTLGKLEPGDDLELLGIPKTDGEGMTRSQCKTSEGKKGWVTIQGNQGSTFMEEHPTKFTQYCEEIDKAIQTSIQNINAVSGFVSEKLKECGTVSTGPLSEAKGKVMKIKTEHVQGKLESLDELKKKVSAAKEAFKKSEQAELEAPIVERQQKEIAEIAAAAGRAVEAATAAHKDLEKAAEPITLLDDEELFTFEKPAAVMQKVEELAAAAHQAGRSASAVIKERKGAAAKITPSTRASDATRKELAKFTIEVEKLRHASARILNDVRVRCAKIVDACYDKICEALRKDVADRTITARKLFDELALGGSISEVAFLRKVESLKDISVSPEHVKLLCLRLGGQSISLLAFLGYVDFVYVVVKDIAVTDEFDVASCNTVRKADKDEVLEALESPKKHEESGLTRIRARAVLDGEEGWVTLSGNQGTPFLKKAEREFLYCSQANGLPLHADFSSEGAKELRTLQEFELLEVIEGPRTETFPDILRAKVKASKDSASGWITLKDGQEVEYAAPNDKMYTIKVSTALTDGMDINDCKIVRKMYPDEEFEVAGEPEEDTEKDLVRVRGKAASDGKEGFITIRGSAGSPYAVPAEKHYTVAKSVALEKEFKSGSAAVRTVDVGEGISLITQPRTETPAPQVRVKVRCFKDGKVGWITRKDSDISKLPPQAKVLERQPLHEAKDDCRKEGAKVLRELSKGDSFILLDGPVKEADVVRIRGRCAKDGSLGWATLRSEERKLLDL